MNSNVDHAPARYRTPVRLDLDGGAILDLGAEDWPDGLLVRVAVDDREDTAVFTLTPAETRRHTPARHGPARLGGLSRAREHPLVLQLQGGRR